MKKQYLLCPVSLSLILCLITGCYPTGQRSVPERGSSALSDIGSTNSDNSAGSENSESSQSTSEIKNLTVTAKLPESYLAEAPTIKNLRLKCWDNQTIKV